MYSIIAISLLWRARIDIAVFSIIAFTFDHVELEPCGVLLDEKLTQVAKGSEFAPLCSFVFKLLASIVGITEKINRNDRSPPAMRLACRASVCMDLTL